MSRYRQERPVAIDLFAGCGGLTRGLREAGFHVGAAVEIDPSTARTYRHNNRRTKLVEGDIRRVRPSDLLGGAQVGEVALVAGCAPCQGFCSLTAKWARGDARNELPLEMARLIEEIRPLVIMMENVPGILSRGRSVFDLFLERIRRLGYLVNYDVVQMADYGVPQSRRRLVLVGGRGFCIPLPPQTRSHAPTPGEGRRAWVTVREAIGHMRAPARLGAARADGGPGAHNWHVVRDLQPQTVARLRAAAPGQTRLSLPEGLRPACHRKGYQGFRNTYCRMSWDDVSPTITAGCTTPCKGRFGHPDRRRTTISVREAALLQTFPESYRFQSDQIDTVCDMIGNAVPPLFARALGVAIRRALERHRDTLARKA